MHQHYVLTLDPHLAEVVDFIQRYELQYEIHLNRTRFWIPPGPIYTEFALRYSQICPPVED